MTMRNTKEELDELYDKIDTIHGGLSLHFIDDMETKEDQVKEINQLIKYLGETFQQIFKQNQKLEKKILTLKKFVKDL